MIVITVEQKGARVDGIEKLIEEKVKANIQTPASRSGSRTQQYRGRLALMKSCQTSRIPELTLRN